MTLQIHDVTDIGSSDLRRLVVDNLVALLGEGASLVENIPQLDDCCVATSHSHDGPVLLCFDAVDSQRALLTGLLRMDQLGSETATLFLQDFVPPAGLLVLAPAAPPGMALFRGPCPVYWRRIQVLSVNGELGMVVGPVVGEAAAAALVQPERRPTIVESVLSPEEDRHFSQL